jgi:hypothetical protein
MNSAQQQAFEAMYGSAALANRSRSGNVRIQRPLSSRIARVESQLQANPKWINPALMTYTNTVTGTSPYTFCVNAVLQGTSENTRIGAKIRMKEFWATFYVQNVATAQQDSNILYRIYLIKESTTLGSNISPSQVWLDANPTPLSMRDHTNRDASRYTFLYDSGVQAVGCQSSALASPFQNLSVNPERVHTVHLKMDILSDQSRANNGNVGDIDTNGVSIVILSDNATSGYLSITGAYLTKFMDV